MSPFTKSHQQRVNETRNQVLSLRQGLRGLSEPNEKEKLKLRKSYPKAKVDKVKEIPFSQFKYPIDVDFQELVQKLKRKESPLEPINVYNHSFIVNPEERCEGDVEMLYMIKSSPNNFVRRDSIRNTWANEPLMRNLSFRVMYLTALSTRNAVNALVKWEGDLHRDLLLIDYIDNYYNNTLKTTGGLKWAAEYCGNARYVMFLDDDFYVNTYKMPTLVDFIDKGNYTYGFMGNVMKVAPIRDKSNKWYISVEAYPYDLYPPFVSAGSWIITQDLLQDMNLVIPYTKRFIYDDVFIAIVAYKLKVKPIVIKHFTMTKVSYRTEAFKVTLTSHGYEHSRELSGAWNCTVAYTQKLDLPHYCFSRKKIPRKRITLSESDRARVEARFKVQFEEYLRKKMMRKPNLMM
ncbi:hypothetical protein FSP39_005956 [Pinctada imbricata]|uniref:Hexosyltransferase n=1 Tax=Pinctada imbricata TaxID=66713 RepID=A0AA88XER2_PINIB|nr:hypothetical protein FSP39_005956 [Pinctada imbricata]